MFTSWAPAIKGQETANESREVVRVQKSAESSFSQSHQFFSRKLSRSFLQISSLTHPLKRDAFAFGLRENVLKEFSCVKTSVIFLSS